MLGATEPPKATKADPVEQVRKAARTAEVHGIGVGGPMNFRLEGIKEHHALVGKLRDKDKTMPVARVWEMLSEETQKRVLDDATFAELGRSAPDKPESAKAMGLRIALSSDLQKVVYGRPDFYTEEAFKNALLNKELKDLIALGKKRTAYQNAKLNWALLEQTFPGRIPEMPERFGTVRVQVVRGKDVVLVLSSRKHCRWEVKLLEGAKVTGVVLCGNESAEVVGVDAPVVYRCYYEQDGVTQAKERSFVGYDTKSEKFKEFVNCVKQITDKDFTSFVSGSPKADHYPTPGDEPYVIYPVANK